MKHQFKLSAAGRAALIAEEGRKTKVYLCSAGVPTCGIGHTGPDVTMDDYRRGRVVTQAQVDAWFEDDVQEFEDAVNKGCTRTPRQDQFDAMVSLAFNIGTPRFLKSCSVLKNFNRGDDAAAARSFGLWNKETVNGKLRENRGLTRRRAREAAMFSTREDSFEVDGFPSQSVADESDLRSSPINRSAAVTGGTAVLGLVSEVTGTAGEIKYQLGGFGEYAVPVALAVVIGACAYIMWNRYKQREGGWA